MTRNLTCISCPMGCYLTVKLEEGAQPVVSGNQCKRGEAYAVTECTNPTRVFSTTVRLEGASFGQLPVKASAPVPKAMVVECVRALKDTAVSPPVHIGDAVLKNVLGTGVDIIATREVLS